jgi:hypothetical protein
MSEAMTVEMIVEADWLLKDFWTKLRFPLRTQGGDWTDIDVLAYNPETKVLVIAESKVYSKKKDVWAYTGNAQGGCENLFDHAGRYLSWLPLIELACKDGVIFEHFEPMVEKLIIQLVSNCVISDDIKSKAESKVSERVRKDVPQSVRLEITLESTLDVIARIICAENACEQERRYGHPVLDIARELNRYMHPRISGAGRRPEDDPIKKEFVQKLLRALGIHSSD